MGENNKEYDRFLSTGTNTDRMQFFSDAVFAIAMTLLVIDIAVPTIAGTVSDAHLDSALWTAIGGQWQSFLAYGISFWVIAINWAGHHRKFRLIHTYDGGLIQLNLWLLFFIAFVPYPTSLISRYAGAMPGIVLYSLEISIVSGLQWWMWRYSYRKGYVDAKVTPGMYAYVSRAFISVPLVFLLSIPVGYIFGGYVAMYFWVLNWPVSALIGRWEPRGTRASRSPGSAS
ncbi:MAG: hypothetical protein JWN80_1225 [Microbacteriaceae bacterium]|nr:hypothetical protein [Microbacteriaceae bacterium]